MKTYNSLNEFSRNLSKSILQSPIKEKMLLEEIGKSLVKQAKNKIGVQQPGWEPLSVHTIDDKIRKGYLFSGDGNPLFRSGELHDSIEHRVETHKVAVGSDSDVALWQEKGTTGPHPIPARSYLASTLFENIPEIAVSLKQFMGSLIRGNVQYRPVFKGKI